MWILNSHLNYKLRLVWLVFPFLLVLTNCNTLPPVSPIDNTQELFDPRYMPWQPAAETSQLSGRWYKDGEPFLELSPDSLFVVSTTASTWQLDFADSYYRLTYRTGSLYHALYLSRISPDSLKFLFSDIPASDPVHLDSIPASGEWQVLTNRLFWQSKPLPDNLLGTWHLSDGVFELEITREQVILDGTAWLLNDVQTHRDDDRFVLGREDSTIVLYYRYASPLIVKIKPLGTTESDRDHYGKLPEKWIILKKWYDFLELVKWQDGATYEYDYNFDSYSVRIINIQTPDMTEAVFPRDSVAEILSMSGKMQLTISGDIESSADGELNVNVTFDIPNSKEIYFRERIYTTVWGKSSLFDIYRSQEDSSETIDNFSWTNVGIVAQRDYSVFMENDTLWIDSPDGKAYLAPRKVDLTSKIGLDIFIFPFDPPMYDFPETSAMTGILNLPAEPEPPQIELPLDNSGRGMEGLGIGGLSRTLLIEGGDMIAWGLIRRSFASAAPNSGLQKIHYSVGKYSRLFWEKSGYVRDHVFTCALASSSP